MDALVSELADAKAKHAASLGGSLDVVAGLLAKLTTMAAELDAYAAHGPADGPPLPSTGRVEVAGGGGDRDVNGIGTTAGTPPDAPPLASPPADGPATADAGTPPSPAVEAMEVDLPPTPPPRPPQLVLKEAVTAARAAKTALTAHQRTIHSAVGRLARRVDDTLPANPETAVAPNVWLERHLLDTAVAGYLVEAGHPGVASALVDEASLSAREVGLLDNKVDPVKLEHRVGSGGGVGGSGGARLCSAAAELLGSPPSLTQLARLLDQLRTGDTDGCVHWGVAHYRALRMTAVGNRLLFKLHSLAFLGYAARGDSDRALRYAQKQLAPYGTMLQRELERLMGAFFVLICAAPRRDDQPAATAAAAVAAAEAMKKTVAEAAAAVPGEVLPPLATPVATPAGGGAAVAPRGLAAKGGSGGGAAAPAGEAAGAAGAPPPRPPTRDGVPPQRRAPPPPRPRSVPGPPRRHARGRGARRV